MPRALTSDIDLYSDAMILSPYGAYRMLRDLGPAVWLEAQSVFAIARYEDVRQALLNHAAFSSASGVAVSESVNAGGRGTLLASDPPQHDELRSVMAKPLSIASLAVLKPRVRAAADEMVSSLLARGEFDAVPDLAQVLPVSIVSHLVGLPEAGRENMLRWASATFDILGPDNARSAEAMPHVLEMRAYATAVAHRGGVTRGGWADHLLDLADAGVVEHERLPSLFRDFMAPSLDTTIFATASLIWLLGQHPDQWQALVEDPSLVRNAVNEAVRLESPVRGFTRRLVTDVDVDGVALPAGSRALLLFASANRDERRWERPESFDVRRHLAGQLGFGFGVHTCAGMHLARLEMECILEALIAKVRRFSIGEPVWALNNTLRGLASLPVQLEAL